MTSFVLTILDDKRSILSTTEPVTPAASAAIREAFDRWLRDGGALFLAECSVKDVRQTTIELDVKHEGDKS